MAEAQGSSRIHELTGVGAPADPVATNQGWVPARGTQKLFMAGIQAFEIARDGSVRGTRIDTSSGVPSLDRSALRAVSDASPLPPLPATWKDATLPAVFVFRLYPD